MNIFNPGEHWIPNVSIFLYQLVGYGIRELMYLSLIYLRLVSLVVCLFEPLESNGFNVSLLLPTGGPTGTFRRDRGVVPEF